MSIITDIMNPNIQLREDSVLFTESEASLETESFDLMNNDVVTLKPNHDLIRNCTIKERKEHQTSDKSALKFVATESRDNQENDLMNFIDYEFDNLVSSQQKFFY